MPKHRKRRIMLSIVSIVLFVVLSAQLSTFSFSVTAAGEHGELVAEELSLIHISEPRDLSTSRMPSSA